MLVCGQVIGIAKACTGLSFVTANTLMKYCFIKYITLFLNIAIDHFNMKLSVIMLQKVYLLQDE